MNKHDGMVAVVMACLAVLASACGDDSGTQQMIRCDAVAITGIEVTVLGAADPDGGTIGVRVIDGSYVEELECGPEDGSLLCSGAYERAGTYRIEVVVNGEVVATEEATVTEDECHVMTEEVTI